MDWLINLLFLIAQLVGTYFLSILAGFLYRAGGTGYPYNTKWRDAGCSLVMLITMFIWSFTSHWISLILCFGLMWGALTTYWKKKGTSAKTINWIFTGLGYSFSMLPFTIVSGKWLGFILRTTILTTFVTVWSDSIGDVEIEERGRGIANNITLPLLFI
jgi:hypothetical protein